MRCPLCLYTYEVYHRFLTIKKGVIMVCLRCYTIITNPILK